VSEIYADILQGRASKFISRCIWITIYLKKHYNGQITVTVKMKREFTFLQEEITYRIVTIKVNITYNFEPSLFQTEIV